MALPKQSFDANGNPICIVCNQPTGLHHKSHHFFERGSIPRSYDLCYSCNNTIMTRLDGTLNLRLAQAYVNGDNDFLAEVGFDAPTTTPAQTTPDTIIDGLQSILALLESI